MVCFMTDNELAKLIDKARQDAEVAETRRRELYQYARDKGFTSREAGILRHKTKEYIDRLAAEKEGR